MTETARTFLGIPIECDFEVETGVRQRTLEEFAPIIQAVLDDPGVEYFGWHQGTPSWNDGEPCRFSAFGFWAMSPDQHDALTEKVDDPEDVWSEDLDGYDVNYGDKAREAFGSAEDSQWGRHPETGAWSRLSYRYEGPDAARYERLQALAKAIDGHAFDAVLAEAFGDGAKIRMSRDGIVIDVYEID